MPVYLRQHAIEGSALGMFKCWCAALLGSRGRYLYYLGSIGVSNVLVELTILIKCLAYTITETI